MTESTLCKPSEGQLKKQANIKIIQRIYRCLFINILPILNKCFLNLAAVSSLCRFCISKMHLILSRAWCGRSSLIRWCMLINKSSMSSSFWSRRVLNVYCWLFTSICCWSKGNWVLGALTRISNRSRYAIKIEWLSFFNSFLWLFMFIRVNECAWVSDVPAAAVALSWDV